MQDYHRELNEKEIKQFVNERFVEVKSSKKIKNLVSFQAMNKYLIMSHNQEQLRIMGRIIASHKKMKLSEIVINYENNLKLALQSKPTVKTHSNVLMHLFGFFSKEFSDLEKEKFFEFFKTLFSTK